MTQSTAPGNRCRVRPSIVDGPREVGKVSTMIVYVSASDADTATDCGATWSLTGTSEDGASRVRFAGDWRTMRDVCRGARTNGRATVVIARRQVRHITPIVVGG